MAIIPVVIGIILDKEGRYLVSKRLHHQPSPLTWEFPGGKVETGESEYEALVRELREEIGIEVINARRSGFLRPSSNKSIEISIWIVERYSGHPSGCEGQAIQWLPTDEFDQHDFIPSTTEILALI